MKLNLTKIIKGLIFLALAILFLMVSFIVVKDRVIFEVGNETLEFSIKQFVLNPYVLGDYFVDFFVKTWHNYAISGLFALLGILELKEGVFNGN